MNVKVFLKNVYPVALFIMLLMSWGLVSASHPTDSTNLENDDFKQLFSQLDQLSNKP